MPLVRRQRVVAGAVYAGRSLAHRHWRATAPDRGRRHLRVYRLRPRGPVGERPGSIATTQVRPNERLRRVTGVSDSTPGRPRRISWPALASAEALRNDE